MIFLPWFAHIFTKVVVSTRYVPFKVRMGLEFSVLGVGFRVLDLGFSV